MGEKGGWEKPQKERLLIFFHHKFLCQNLFTLNKYRVIIWVTMLAQGPISIWRETKVMEKFTLLLVLPHLWTEQTSEGE